MVPRRRNTRGFTDPLRPCGTCLRPPQGPDVCLPKNVTLRGSSKGWDWPANVNLDRTKTVSRLRQSVCVVIALRPRGTITEPLENSCFCQQCFQVVWVKKQLLSIPAGQRPGTARTRSCDCEDGSSHQTVLGLADLRDLIGPSGGNSALGFWIRAERPNPSEWFDWAGNNMNTNGDRSD